MNAIWIAFQLFHENIFENSLKKGWGGGQGQGGGACNCLTPAVCRLSEIEDTTLSHDCYLQAKEFKFEHTDGLVPQAFGGEILCQFKVLSMDGVILKTSSRDSCIKIRFYWLKILFLMGK